MIKLKNPLNKIFGKKVKGVALEKLADAFEVPQVLFNPPLPGDYTAKVYGKIKVSPRGENFDGKLNVTVKVYNDGKYTGKSKLNFRKEFDYGKLI